MSDLGFKLPEVLVDIDDGVIDLGWGHPSPDLHPLGKMQHASEKLFELKSSVPLQYGAAQGYGPFLENLAIFLSRQSSYTNNVSPLNLFLTAGASQGIDLACTLFAKAGDVVFVEEPTYFVIEKILQDHHLNISGISIDSNGIIISDLREKLESGLRPKFIYTIPTFQNPTGISLSTERRKQLLSLAEEYDFYIFADEVYQLLSFDIEPPSSLLNFDNSNRVIEFGSFSKILAPGLRTGWIQASQEIISRFTDAALTFSGGGFNHYTSVLINNFIELGYLDENIDCLKQIYSERAERVSNSLLKNFNDDISFTHPQGGFYFWLQFPEAFDAEKFLPLAEEHGVSFRPGNAFSASAFFNNYLRLTYTLYDSNSLADGVTRLAKAYKEYSS
ncbi:MAG: PLP-dependent aminotransferase family protein [Dehalococcoidia bacterium]|nr:PLP-dependent aminotransferase family protein [Dehalococcoidia bacterium]